jgi:hypothetical protein
MPDWKHLASELGDHIDEAETRLSETRWLCPISLNVSVGGRDVELKMDASEVETPRRHAGGIYPRSALVPCILSGLNEAGLTATEREHPGRGGLPIQIAEFTLTIDEFRRLESAASYIVDKASGIAEHRKTLISLATHCARRAIDLLAAGAVEAAIQEARYAEAVERSVDPERAYWCEAHGGGNATRDVTGRTFLFIRDYIVSAVKSSG